MAHAKADESLIRNKSLSPEARLLMLEIKLRTWRSGETDASVSKFAESLDVSPKRIMKAMRELVDSGLVGRTRRQNNNAITFIIGDDKSGTSNSGTSNSGSSKIGTSLKKQSSKSGSAKSGSSSLGSAESGSTFNNRVDKTSEIIDNNTVAPVPSNREIAKKVVNEYVSCWLRTGRRWPAGFKISSVKQRAEKHVDRILCDEKSTEIELFEIIHYGIRLMLDWDPVKYRPYKVSNVFGQAAYWMEWRDEMQSAGRPGSKLTDDFSSRPQFSEEDVDE